MLETQFIGYIGKDARVTQKENQLAITFSVGVTKTWRNRQNEQQNKTFWIGCTIWKDVGKDNISQWLKTGVKVFVRGEPSARAYLDAEGKAVGVFDCRVSIIELQNKAEEPAPAAG